MFIKLVFILAISGALVLLLSRLSAALYTAARTGTVENISPARVAVVFGAGLTRDGRPSVILRDRVQTAVDLYFAGKAEKLLMSGDNRFVEYNEPGAMQQYAISLGVPAEDIVLDYAGRRTYDTCYRAREIFGLDEAILVTQHFHLIRAVLICNLLGLPAQGVSADQRSYHPIWTLRELPATLVAYWDVWVRRPLPVLGTPEPIFPKQEAIY